MDISHHIVSIHSERDQKMLYIKHDVFIMTMSHDKTVIEENVQSEHQENLHQE